MRSWSLARCFSALGFVESVGDFLQPCLEAFTETLVNALFLLLAYSD